MAINHQLSQLQVQNTSVTDLQLLCATHRPLVVLHHYVSVWSQKDQEARLLGNQWSG